MYEARRAIRRTMPGFMATMSPRALMRMVSATARAQSPEPETQVQLPPRLGPCAAVIARQYRTAAEVIARG
jgi:hypothetical protein